MVHLFVKLTAAADQVGATKRKRRSTPEEVRLHLADLKRTADVCSTRIQALLPPGAELSVLETIGGIVIALPSGDAASSLKDKIKAVCGDAIAGFSNDAEIELLDDAKSHR